MAGLEEQWALLIVGGIALLIGIAFALAGANRMKAAAHMPERTLEQVRADIGMAREQMK